MAAPAPVARVRRWYANSGLQSLHPDALHRLTDILLPPLRQEDAKQTPQARAATTGSNSAAAPRPFQLLLLGSQRTRNERATFAKQLLSFLDCIKRPAYNRDDSNQQKALGAKSERYRVELLDLWDCPLTSAVDAAAAEAGGAPVPAIPAKLSTSFLSELQCALRGDFLPGCDRNLHLSSTNRFRRAHMHGSPPYVHGVVWMLHADEAADVSLLPQLASVAQACSTYGVKLPKGCPVSGVFVCGVRDSCTPHEYLPLWSCRRFQSACIVVADACKLPLDRFLPWCPRAPDALSREEFVFWCAALTAPLAHALEAQRHSKLAKGASSPAALSSSSFAPPLTAHMDTLSWRIHSLAQWSSYAQQRIQLLSQALEHERHASPAITSVSPVATSNAAVTVAGQLRVSDEMGMWITLYESSLAVIQARSDKLQKRLQECRQQAVAL